MNNGKNTNAARALAMGVAAALVIVGMAGTGAAVSGLVGEWHFDGNAQDSSGNGNHGTISGATFVTGISGQALSFDGVDDYVTSGNGSSLNFGAGYFSLSAWIKTTAMGNADNEAVIYFSGSNGYYYFGIHPGNPNPNGASFIINNGPTQDASYGTTNLFDGKWHNIVFTRDATSLKVFTDGIQEGSQPSRGLDVGTGTTTISRKESSWFNGLIDEVRIYNRALTASEIQAEYNALTSTPIPTTVPPTTVPPTTVPPTTPTPTTPTPTTPAPTTPTPSKPSVSLHGEKTDVVLGEDILLKLSAVNLITKPKMHVQVIIIPPSGMSVTSSEFSKSGAGQFTANYELEPGDGKDIEVRIQSNQVGQFNVDGRVVYYFGDDKDTGGDTTLSLPIRVREVASVQNPIENSAQKSIPGFGALIGMIGLLFIALLKKRRR